MSNVSVRHLSARTYYLLLFTYYLLLNKMPLSILIPTHNYRCAELVRTLQMQAENVDGLRYEIIVADDASTDETLRHANRVVREWDCCRLIELEENIGRSRVRNFLARQAQHATLLFLDCDVRIIRPDFLRTYLAKDRDEAVVCGGVTIVPDEKLLHNLRYRYERACLQKFSVERRAVAPYQSFRTTNFLVSREVMLRVPFDEGILGYGYEDVAWGRALQAGGIGIVHIDNPVAVDDFEDNPVFLRKTREAMHTLSLLRSDMEDYSHIVALASRLERWHMAGAMRSFYSLVEPMLVRNLEGLSPKVPLFQLFRLGTFLKMSGE